MIILYEMVGRLVLMCHWLRGIFTWMHFTGAVKYSTEAQKQNYERLNNLLEDMEARIWEACPPRAMLPMMRDWRKTGNIDPDFQELLVSGPWGRFTGDIKDLNDNLLRILDPMNELKK